MKSIKTLLFGTVVVAGIGLFAGANDASASTAYTVNPGDTLSSISTQFYGSSDGIDEIAAASGVQNINIIQVGQQLVIPTAEEIGSGYVAAASTPETTYVEETYVAETPSYTSSVSGSESSAKEWIAMKESSGSYTAQNGQYYGRYQLTSSYLNGDYSAANQEATADAYVAERYGSWSAAQSFWLANGWY